VLLLSGCGGGVGTNGTGAAPQSAGTGTVTGFGSVIIDGVAYDDSQAQVISDAEAGEELSEVKLGQRVSVEYEAAEGAGEATGQADFGAVDPCAVWWRRSTDGLSPCWAKTVQVNDGAVEGVEGPVTVLEGFETLSALAGQAVEIHAMEVMDGASRVWQATRIEAVGELSDRSEVRGHRPGHSPQCRRRIDAPVHDRAAAGVDCAVRCGLCWAGRWLARAGAGAVE
jgi:hypothetical protein